MARKTKKGQSKQESNGLENPLDQVEELRLNDLDPTFVVEPASSEAPAKPISPLGPPQAVTKPTVRVQHPVSGAQSEDAAEKIRQLEVEMLQLSRANKRLERRNIELDTAVKLQSELQADLKAERKHRLDAERRAASMEAQLKQSTELSEALETERKERLQLEKKLSSLEVRAERAQEIALMLQDEREARQKLEKEKASLDVQVESLRKIEKLLTEERQARMNAQSRAASAEAQLARLEGEQKNSGSGTNPGGSFMDRLRGK